MEELQSILNMSFRWHFSLRIFIHNQTSAKTTSKQRRERILIAAELHLFFVRSGLLSSRFSRDFKRSKNTKHFNNRALPLRRNK